MPTELDTDPFTRPPSEELDEPALPPRAAKKPAVTEDGHLVAPDPEPGDRVGDYILDALLGRGGAGAVFKAQGHDGTPVAIKVLAASKVKRARVVQRFFDEARAASLVDHPGLIKVLAFIEEEEPRRLAYVMEYVDGETLRSRIQREHSLVLKLAIQVGIQICDALAALHAAGIVHRDLKPENILLAHTPDGQPPRVKLLDFGVVKFLPVDPSSGGLEHDGSPGTFVGTPRYMAPEQAAGAPVDARADVFALGVMLFEMITGRCPHDGDSLRDVVLAKLKGAPLITVNPEKELLPQELTALVDNCLQLKPSLRPPDSVKVASALREAETVLLAVGLIRYGDSGETIRSESQVVPSVPQPRPSATPVPQLATTPRPEALIVTTEIGRPGSVTVTAGVAGTGPSITASQAAPMPSLPTVPSGPPPPVVASAPAGEDGSRRVIILLLGLVFLAGALVIALAARQLLVPEDAVLLMPVHDTFEPEARSKTPESPRPQVGTSTAH